MTISLLHNFTSAKSDSGDATLVQPSNWNEEHVLTMSSGFVIGRNTAGTGAAEEISYATLAAAGGYVTLTGAETLTNKTITSAAFSGTQTGNFTTTGSFKVDSSGTATISSDAGAATNQAEFALMTNGVKRFVLAKTDEAETGSNAGSNFEIEVWGDAGFYQSSPFKIRRSDARVIMAGVDATTITTSGVITADGATTAAMVVDAGSSGNAAWWQMNTSGSIRWQVSKSSDAETGSNAGSNYVINRYSDAGAFVEQAFVISRATGNVTIANALTVTDYVKTTATTVAGLPSASSAGAGARSFVTDANATTFASVVAGGGANGVPVYSDGTSWRIG